jgi:hypothetical protein
MYHSAAVWCLRHRSRELVEATIDLLEESRRRGTEIPNPGGWLYTALKETWAAPLGTVEEPPTDPQTATSGRRSAEPTDVTAIFDPLQEETGAGESKPKGWSWERARRVLQENELLDRLPDLSHWFEVLNTPSGRRYRPTESTRRYLDNE